MSNRIAWGAFGEAMKGIGQAGTNMAMYQQKKDDRLLETHNANKRLDAEQEFKRQETLRQNARIDADAMETENKSLNTAATLARKKALEDKENKRAESAMAEYGSSYALNEKSSKHKAEIEKRKGLNKMYGGNFDTAWLSKEDQESYQWELDNLTRRHDELGKRPEGPKETGRPGQLPREIGVKETGRPGQLPRPSSYKKLLKDGFDPNLVKESSPFASNPDKTFNGPEDYYDPDEGFFTNDEVQSIGVVDTALTPDQKFERDLQSIQDSYRNDLINKNNIYIRQEESAMDSADSALKGVYGTRLVSEGGHSAALDIEQPNTAALMHILVNEQNVPYEKAKASVDLLQDTFNKNVVSTNLVQTTATSNQNNIRTTAAAERGQNFGLAGDMVKAVATVSTRDIAVQTEGAKDRQETTYKRMKEQTGKRDNMFGSAAMNVNAADPLVGDHRTFVKNDLKNYSNSIKTSLKTDDVEAAFDKYTGLLTGEPYTDFLDSNNNVMTKKSAQKFIKSFETGLLRYQEKFGLKNALAGIAANGGFKSDHPYVKVANQLTSPYGVNLDFTGTGQPAETSEKEPVTPVVTPADTTKKVPLTVEQTNAQAQKKWSGKPPTTDDINNMTSEQMDAYEKWYNKQNK